jgi:hypothetical protein
MGIKPDDPNRHSKLSELERSAVAPCVREVVASAA